MKSKKEFRSALVKLGERIYQRRIVKNLTTKEIASNISLSPEAYRNIEKGITDLSFTTLLSIANILAVNCSELINNL